MEPEDATTSRPLAITLVVIACNEAESIGRCLDSVTLVDEKIVVDSGSTDDTAAIAAACGARVIHQPWLGFGPQRNFASLQARNDWILVLDADEMLTPALSEELRSTLPALMDSNAAGAMLRRTNSYMGAPMHWYRPMVGERISRLYHRGRARWSDARVHESLQFDGPVASLKQPFIHFQNPTLVHKQLKVLRYGELKATDWLDRARPPRLWTCPFVFLATFVKDYFLRLAFLDGWRGYVIAQTAASQAVYKRLRYYEMCTNPQSRALGRELFRAHDLGP
ncbi:MAG TPA: glycosyltransferase family 2 protein [Steroidobacteraceae bacterium]|jgi:glycosyltransferase involved in cell wall biosynthesis